MNNGLNPLSSHSISPHCFSLVSPGPQPGETKEDFQKDFVKEAHAQFCPELHHLPGALGHGVAQGLQNRRFNERAQETILREDLTTKNFVCKSTKNTREGTRQKQINRNVCKHYNASFPRVSFEVTADQKKVDIFHGMKKSRSPKGLLRNI